MSSQPETELSGGDEELNGDAAVLEQLAKRREEAAVEGAEAEDEQEEAEQQADESEQEAEQVEQEVDEDPEIDLGDMKVKKSQVLAWKEGEMKDADYRRKTAEVAEAKRVALAQQERVEQERSHYANQLDVLIGQLQSELVGDQQALAQLAMDDPAAWVRQNATMQQKIQRFQQAIGERQVIEQRTNEEAERKRSERQSKSVEALHAALPEWRDEAVKAKELADMDAWLRTKGYADGDMEAFLDHRVFLLARKAWQAETRDAARATAQSKQVKPQPPKALKPGAATNENKSKDAYREAVRKAKSGREEDILALMEIKRRNA